jgi:hypothetical protein
MIATAERSAAPRDPNREAAVVCSEKGGRLQSCVFALSLLLFALLFAAQPLRAASDPIVIPLDDVDLVKIAATNEAAQDALRRFRDLGVMNVVDKQLRAVQLDPSVLDKLLLPGPGGDETTIRLVLFDGIEVDIVGSPVPGSTGTGLHVWSGNVTVLRQGQQPSGINVPCTLEWNNRVVIANIDLPGGPVRIRTLGPGLHAIFRVDADGLPEEHPPRPSGAPGVRVGDAAGEDIQFAPVQTIPSTGAKIAASAAPHKDSAGRTVISIAFAFTNDAAKEIWADQPGKAPFDPSGVAPLLHDFATTQVTAANKALANNGIAIVLVLKATTQRNIDEPSNTANFAEYINSLLPASSVKARGNDAKGLHCWWAEQQANSLVLVGSFGGNPGNKKNIPGFCGASNKPSGMVTTEADLRSKYEDPPNQAGHFGYSVVKKVCADLHYTFLHELGHQLGADHEDAKASPNALTLMPGVASGNGQPSAFGNVVSLSDPRVVTVEVVGTNSKDRKFRVPAFTSAKRVVKPADPRVADDKWGDPKHDDAKIIAVMAEQLSKRTIPRCP